MERTLRLRLAASAAILALLAVLHIPALRPAIVENPLTERLDQAAEENLRAGLARALGVYAVARGINAVVSVVQESRLDVSLLGVGGSVAAGEILDPVNDLVEHVSWVLLASAMSLGIQLAMLKAGGWLGLEVLLSLALLVLLAGLWSGGERGAAWRGAAGRLALAALLVRFCVPVAAVGGEAFFQRVLRDQYEQAAVGVESFREDIAPAVSSGSAGSAGPASPEGTEVRGPLSRDGESEGGPAPRREPEKESLWDAARAFAPAEIAGRARLIRDRMDGYVENAVTLMVVFTVQTVLLPLAMLWLLVRGVNLLAGGELVVVPRAWFGRSGRRPEN